MGQRKSVAQIGMDIHRTFSRVTARDAQRQASVPDAPRSARKTVAQVSDL